MPYLRVFLRLQEGNKKKTSLPPLCFCFIFMDTLLTVLGDTLFGKTKSDALHKKDDRMGNHVATPIPVISTAVAILQDDKDVITDLRAVFVDIRNKVLEICSNYQTDDLSESLPPLEVINDAVYDHLKDNDLIRHCRLDFDGKISLGTDPQMIYFDFRRKLEKEKLTLFDNCRDETSNTQMTISSVDDVTLAFSETAILESRMQTGFVADRTWNFCAPTDASKYDDTVTHIADLAHVGLDNTPYTIHAQVKPITIICLRTLFIYTYSEWCSRYVRMVCVTAEGCPESAEFYFVQRNLELYCAIAKEVEVYGEIPHYLNAHRLAPDIKLTRQEFDHLIKMMQRPEVGFFRKENKPLEQIDAVTVYNREEYTKLMANSQNRLENMDGITIRRRDENCFAKSEMSYNFTIDCDLILTLK